MRKIHKIASLVGLLALPLSSIACHVAGYIWYDINRNGRMDDGEEKISGVSVKIYKDVNNDGIPDSSVPFRTAVTNSSGYYYKDLVAEDRFIVEIVTPSGYDGFTTKNASGVSNNRSSKFNSTGKTNSMWIDIEEQVHAGLVKNIAIGDKVWFDVNRDGRQDADEPGIPAAIVKLYLDENSDNIADSETPIATKTTDGNGEYLFTQISPRKYFVQFEIPAGYTGLTTQDATGVPLGQNSTPNVITGKTGTHNFTTDYLYKDAGYLKNIQLSGKIFLDNNALEDNTVNGMLISSVVGETLFANLFKGGSLVASQAIVDGAYLFENIAGNGNYTVTISTIEGFTSSALPATWVSTGENIGLEEGDDGTVDGILNVSVGLNSIENVNFGLEPIPVPEHYVCVSQLNPGGANTVAVMSAAFTGIDSEGGIVEKLRITSFPVNIDRLLIGEDEYTNTTFPLEGIILNTNEAGNPVDEIKIDPIDGDVDVVFLYKVIDNGGFESNETGSVTLPFFMNPLAVNWLYFDVKKTEKSISLDWGTALEENCKEFVIERSIDGQSNWIQIGTINSKAINGNSSSKLVYNFNDAEPLKAMNYYRIKQVDINGKFTYTDVKAIFFDESDALASFPNPVKDQLNIKGLKEGNVISIYNITGQKVVEYKSKTDFVTLSLNNLNTGTYLIQVLDGSKLVYAGKLIKE